MQVPDQPVDVRRRRLPPSLAGPVGLVAAAHPGLAAVTAVGVGLAALASGRGAWAAALVVGTVLVGQVVLGWTDDLLDEADDRRHDRRDRPLVGTGLERGTLGFALACAVLLVVPLSIANGVPAGLSHLGLLVVAVLGQWAPLRTSRWSWLPWAASYALWPAFLSYGTQPPGPPTLAITGAAALLGVAVHVAAALPGLPGDREDGLRHLPGRLAVHLGATRLTRVTPLLLGLAVVAVVATWVGPGLRR